MGKQKRGSIEKREARAFYLFISPWLIGFVCITAVPMLYAIYAAFTNWDGINVPNFIGVKNFVEMVTRDKLFFKSLKNTFYYACVSIPLNLTVALLLAMLVNKRYRGHSLFRSLFYLPSVLAGVAIFIVWGNLFSPSSGYINYFLSLIGIQGPGWLQDKNWAMPAIILMNVTTCGGTMMIFLAGLQDIPEDMYEAAKMDGAGKLASFFYVTLPLLSPVIFYNLLMGIIRGLQIFTEPYIMTGGGPVNSTFVYGLLIYNNAFTYMRMGYACALSLVMFAITLVIGIVVMKTSDNWVYSEK